MTPPARRSFRHNCPFLRSVGIFSFSTFGQGACGSCDFRRYAEIGGNNVYAELVKDPLIVAVFSALIGVALSQLGTHLYGSWTHSRKRASILQVLRHQLQNHKQQLTALEDSLGKNCIYSALDPSPVLHFLNGDVVALPRDDKLVASLYTHLGNIEMLRRAIDIIGMRSAGFTSVHNEQKEALEQSLKEAIPGILAEVDSCLKELPK